mgnify:CR=1 FL=1|tara:strand:- start:33 stop:761 length:729 start_codon:yes stop_codon:yes gene_type:complete
MKSNTINIKEIQKFSKMADEWWDPNGKFKPLHKFNPVRIKYIKNYLINHFNIKNKYIPLKNLNILDIGCGGGLLSEPMSRLGANVTGIDASEKNIKIAKIHSKKSNLKINYRTSSPEKFLTEKKFDVVLNMEIVEHVDDLNFFIKQSSNYLKKNGLMFIATINRTLESYIFAIVGAEYILRWLPIGTHEWTKFVKPSELNNFSKKNSLEFKKIDGIKFNPILNEWKVSKDHAVNYISIFKKT